ncbi:MAG: hypothetical protein SFX72_14435 [Isosphaeraceae bacterium]|nr:hypothetical protein [Isosphaeraceae bacterium]
MIISVFPRRHGSRVLLTTLLSLFAATSARGEILFSSGFEAPSFVSGRTINGQTPFVTPPGTLPASMIVTNTLPFAGNQAVQGVGSDLRGIPDFVFGTAQLPLNYNVLATGLPRISIEAQLRLDGPNTNTGNGLADNDASVALEANLGDSTYFSLQLSSNGMAYVFTDSYNFATPAPLGQYHRLQLLIDLGSGVGTYSLNGAVLGTLPISTPSYSRILADVRFSMYALSSQVDPSNYNGRMDDLSVTALVPEPASSTLLGLGTLLFVRHRRRLASSR